MNNKIIYLLTFIILSASLFSKPRGRNKGYDKKFINQYCDLKKNLSVALVKVNDKSGQFHTDVTLSKGYYTYLGTKVFVSVGDASLASDRCRIGEVNVGKEISDGDLECILDNLNKKNKYNGIVSNPEDSGWQRGSVQSLDDIERYNRVANKNGEKLISYREFQLPETRTLMEDLVYTQIENGLVNASQFTVADRANMSESLSELKNQYSGIFNESNQKELGKMLGTDLIGVADISAYSESTKKKSGLGGSERYSVATIEVILKLINVETGVLFTTLKVSAKNEMKGRGKAHKSRAVCLTKYSESLSSELDNSMKEFPFESVAKITKRGAIYVYSGSVDGVMNDMIFDLFISEYDEDDDEYYEDIIGQIKVVDNEKGRGVKAGTKSQCEALDFSESLDREEEYLVRIPKDIKSKMKCK